MDNRSRPIPGKNQNGQHNANGRPANNSVPRQHAVHKTPEELARTRVVPTVKSQNNRPTATVGRTPVNKTQNDRLEFSVSSPMRSQSSRNTSQPQNVKMTTVRYEERPIGIRILSGIGKGFAFFFTFLIVLLIVLAISFKMIASNSNPAAQEMFVTTLLETGQLKFLANMFASQEDIDRIVEANKSKTIDADVDTSLIDIPKGNSGSVDISGGGTSVPGNAEEPIVIEEIAGASYHATMMIVKDPSRVSVATIYPWREEGDTLDQIANSCGAIGAINGGLYNSYNNSGGMPYGVVVSNHEIQFNEPENFVGLFLIGLTDDNILEVIDINGWSAAQVENVIAEKKIRDAVTFQEEASDSNNHFVQLIINGERPERQGRKRA